MISYKTVRFEGEFVSRFDGVTILLFATIMAEIR